MPLALARACQVYGCTEHAPCPTHGRQAQQQVYDDRRGTSHQRGYTTKQWAPFRQWYFDELVRLNVPRAGLCGARLLGTPATQDSECAQQGLIVVGRVVDHIRPVSGPHDPHFYNPLNLQLLCDGTGQGRGCHDRKRARESRHPMQTYRRVVVTGPPGSGKSTYVRQHAQPGDICWDLDAIASTLSYAGAPLTTEQKGSLPWPVVGACLAMRDALIAWLATTTTSASVYLIVSKQEDAEDIARRIVAEVVTPTRGEARTA